MEVLKILGLDPGSANFAYSFVEVRMAGPFDYRVRELGMMKRTIRLMNGDVHKDIRSFRSELGSILRRHKADVIVAERYMNRGIRGNTGELVGLMLGAVALAPVQDVTFIPASQWKNAFNRNADLKLTYDQSRLVPHVIDATAIALYGACSLLDVKPFSFLSDKKKQRVFLTRLDGATIR